MVKTFNNNETGYKAIFSLNIKFDCSSFCEETQYLFTALAETIKKNVVITSIQQEEDFHNLSVIEREYDSDPNTFIVICGINYDTYRSIQGRKFLGNYMFINRTNRIHFQNLFPGLRTFTTRKLKFENDEHTFFVDGSNLTNVVAPSSVSDPNLIKLKDATSSRHFISEIVGNKLFILWNYFLNNRENNNIRFAITKIILEDYLMHLPVVKGQRSWKNQFNFNLSEIQINLTTEEPATETDSKELRNFSQAFKNKREETIPKVKTFFYLRNHNFNEIIKREQTYREREFSFQQLVNFRYRNLDEIIKNVLSKDYVQDVIVLPCGLQVKIKPGIMNLFKEDNQNVCQDIKIIERPAYDLNIYGTRYLPQVVFQDLDFQHPYISKEVPHQILFKETINMLPELMVQGAYEDIVEVIYNHLSTIFY